MRKLVSVSVVVDKSMNQSVSVSNSVGVVKIVSSMLISVTGSISVIDVEMVKVLVRVDTVVLVSVTVLGLTIVIDEVVNRKLVRVTLSVTKTVLDRLSVVGSKDVIVISFVTVCVRVLRIVTVVVLAIVLVTVEVAVPDGIMVVWRVNVRVIVVVLKGMVNVRTVAPKTAVKYDNKKTTINLLCTISLKANEEENIQVLGLFVFYVQHQSSIRMTDQNSQTNYKHSPKLVKFRILDFIFSLARVLK